MRCVLLTLLLVSWYYIYLFEDNWIRATINSVYICAELRMRALKYECLKEG